jgi:hypothetical protein
MALIMKQRLENFLNVYTQHKFLAASPDGLIDQDAILEICSKYGSIRCSKKEHN